MDLQFYPTPFALAEKAWSLFKSSPRDSGSKILEPSAGTASLMEPLLQPSSDSWMARERRNQMRWDACEFDTTKHARLREQGARVVGVDFLAFQGGEVYSHIIMNPPFAHGCEHLLHAWDILYDGEIVCILNAETVRNQFSKERQHLGRMIERFGSVEFVEQAFTGEDVERETSVEVALVYLRKAADSSAIVGDILGNLAREESKIEDTMHLHAQNQLALPKGLVEDLVVRFNLAVNALRESAQAGAKAAYYRRLLGHTLAETNKRESSEHSKPDPQKETPDIVKAAFATGYAELKDAAWTGVLRSGDVLSKLSSAAQRRMEKEFENIKQLEFTASNIYGFLLGVCEAAGEIQIDMVCDVFDLISRYHDDNTVFYMGWKSNTKHRTAGMRLKTTRFVLPGFQLDGWRKSLDFDHRQTLADFDKVFTMLDGKTTPGFGLNAVFDQHLDELRHGERCTSDYFDVRYYPKRGTIHFFPRSKELMDRLNRIVGQRRQWLPPVMEEASADFVKQYAQAEQFDKEIRVAFKAEGGGNRSDFHYLMHAHQGHEYAEFSQVRMNNAIEKVLDSHGIHPFEELAHTQGEQLLLTM